LPFSVLGIFDWPDRSVAAAVSGILFVGNYLTWYFHILCSNTGWIFILVLNLPLDLLATVLLPGCCPARILLLISIRGVGSSSGPSF